MRRRHVAGMPADRDVVRRTRIASSEHVANSLRHNPPAYDDIRAAIVAPRPRRLARISRPAPSSSMGSSTSASKRFAARAASASSYAATASTVKSPIATPSEAHSSAPRRLRPPESTLGLVISSEPPKPSSEARLKAALRWDADQAPPVRSASDAFVGNRMSFLCELVRNAKRTSLCCDVAGLSSLAFAGRCGGIGASSVCSMPSSRRALVSL